MRLEDRSAPRLVLVCPNTGKAAPSMKADHIDNAALNSSCATSVPSVAKDFDFQQAKSPEQLGTVRELLLEYAQSLGFRLCFQSFDDEIAGLPGDYVPPEGRLLLATSDVQAAGCVALHKLD